jgi:hypothetical protein
MQRVRSSCSPYPAINDLLSISSLLQLLHSFRFQSFPVHLAGGFAELRHSYALLLLADEASECVFFEWQMRVPHAAIMEADASWKQACFQNSRSAAATWVECPRSKLLDHIYETIIVCTMHHTNMQLTRDNSVAHSHSALTIASPVASSVLWGVHFCCPKGTRCLKQIPGMLDNNVA